MGHVPASSLWRILGPTGNRAVYRSSKATRRCIQGCLSPCVPKSTETSIHSILFAAQSATAPVLISTVAGLVSDGSGER